MGRIDAHVESAVEYTTRATNDTKKALEYQTKARRCHARHITASSHPNGPFWPTSPHSEPDETVHLVAVTSQLTPVPNV